MLDIGTPVSLLVLTKNNNRFVCLFLARGGFDRPRNCWRSATLRRTIRHEADAVTTRPTRRYFGDWTDGETLVALLLCGWQLGLHDNVDQQCVYSYPTHSITASLALWLRRPPRERKVPGSNPACTGFFFRGRIIPCDFKIGTPVATLPDAWRYRVSAGTGWPGVSIL